jgi:hypothetical protein
LIDQKLGLFSKTPDLDFANASPSEIYNFAWEAGLKQFDEKIKQQNAHKVIVAMHFIDDSFRLLQDAYDCLFNSFGSYQAGLMYNNDTETSRFQIQKHCIAYCAMSERMINAYRNLKKSDPSIEAAHDLLVQEIYANQPPFRECIKALRNAIMHGEVIKFSPTSTVTLGSKTTSRELQESAIHLEVDTSSDYFNSTLQEFIAQKKSSADQIFLKHFEMAKKFYNSYYTKFSYHSRKDLDFVYKLKEIASNVSSVSMLNMMAQFTADNSAFKYLHSYFNSDEITRIRSIMPDYESAANYAISLRDPLNLTPRYAKDRVIELFKKGCDGE